MPNFQDREMLFDILTSCRASLKEYAGAISLCVNDQLRQFFLDKLNEDVKFFHKIYQLAVRKGWAQPSPDATPQDCNDVISQLESCGCKIPQEA